jgi:hypothetical protein
VPLAVTADRVARREDVEEVRVEVRGRSASQPARAGQAIRFLVDLAVIPLEVIRLEGLQEMVGNPLISEFREPARALHGSHVITFFLCIIPVG